MGKIFNALEKYLKETPGAQGVEPLSNDDCEVLLLTNQYTRTLNIHNRQVVKDPSAVERLIAHQMIRDDGKLTEKGLKKYEELIYERRVAMAGQSGDRSEPDDGATSEGPDDTPVPLKESDLEALAALVEAEKQTEVENTTSGENNQARVFAIGDEVFNRLLAHGFITSDGRPTFLGIKKIRRAKGPHSAPSKADDAVAPGDGRRTSAEILHHAEERGKEPLRNVFTENGRFVWSAAKESPPESVKEEVTRSAEPIGRIEPATIDPNLVTLLAPQSFMAERFKILRTNLLYPVGKPAPRSLLITSLNPGDGKSFVAANLAVSVAMNINRYVLLMDCDLRKPTIHTQFGFGDCPGLSEYLTQGLSLASLLRQTRVDRLSILSGGSPPPNPSELLSSNRMAHLIREVTDRYPDRLIIIDSPPPSLTSETGVLARMAEGILVVVRHYKTNREELKALCEQFGKEKIVGSVLNYYEHSGMNTKGYRYYRKYGDYAY